MTEHHGQVVSGLNVTEHEERNEHQACGDQDGQPDAVFTGLNREQRTESTFRLQLNRNISADIHHHHLQDKMYYILFVKSKTHCSVNVNTVLAQVEALKLLKFKLK